MVFIASGINLPSSHFEQFRVQGFTESSLRCPFARCIPRVTSRHLCQSFHPELANCFDLKTNIKTVVVHLFSICPLPELQFCLNVLAITILYQPLNNAIVKGALFFSRD